MSLIDVPDIVPASEKLEAGFRDVHEFPVRLLLPVTALHAGAALRHHFLLRDDVVKRMVLFWNQLAAQCFCCGCWPPVGSSS